jgi:type I restriction enzyme, S subunit
MYLNDIGHNWIGDIPKHWNVKRIKHMFHIKKEVSEIPDNEDILSLTFKGIIKRDVSTNEGQLPETYSGYTKIYPDDIVMNPMDLRSGWVDRSVYKGIISPSYYVLNRNSESTDIGYFNYQFQRHYKERIFFPFGQGVSYDYRWGLGKETLLNFPIIVPPPTEQQQISNYLDHKTQQIDSLIEKTQQKIELLKEQRISLINQVVTKGLNPDVEMKDSGVEWIGEIPSGWVVSKLKYDTLTPVKYGMNISGDKYVDEGIRFIRITDLTDWGELIKDNGKYLLKDDVTEEFLLRKYDLLLCRSGHTVGKSYLHLEDGYYTSGGYLVRFNFGNYSNSKYIFYITKTDFYWYWIKLNTVTSTIENVNGEKYSNMVYPRPTDTEQQQIVDHLDKETTKIDSIIEKETQRIELLKEYRQSLISEVVTGKVDVRDEVVV